MTKPMVLTILIAALIVGIVSVDVLFFRDRFWERLMANAGIVLLSVALYSRFVK